MEHKAKRPCKSCPKCNAKFSDRHARRHLLECKVTFCERINVSNKASIEKLNESNTSMGETHEISDDEPEMNYEPFNKVRKLGLNNLEEEDINIHFDATGLDENSDFSDSYSDVDPDFEFLEEKDNVENFNIKEKTYWFCKILVLWQCIYYISDAAIGVLLKLLSIFFKAFYVKSDIHEKVNHVFPQNVNQLSKLLQSDMLDFKQYVVCTSCFSLYEFEDCYNVIEGCKISKKCSFIEFPNHRLPHLRKKCNQTLLMEVNNSTTKILVPIKIFCYKSVESSLQQFVKRSNFEDLCEQWRQRETKKGVLYDIYDGNIWNEFNGSKQNFFTTQYNYGCMLNVDWFQPYKHTSCSIGVMYLAFLNLPREVRHRRENVLLVGVIPDMKSEPKTNTFLKPLVQELKQAWDDGFLLYSHKSPNTLKCFKLALICVGCDIPASRKLCGFLGHSATSGCNKCKKKFPGSVGEKNYGGFDRTEWIPRDNQSHREECNEILMCTCKGDKEKLERQFGTRYSSLLELVYFDPVRMTPIDPMHNLFLGTAKHMITVWKTKKLLFDDDFKKIQSRVEPFICPSDIGRLPNKFSSSFGSFNADQFKNWTLLFSVYALYDILPAEHLECWRKFVLACRRLCSMFISVNNVKVADRLLIDFLKKFEQLYGSDFVTPNMHLHGHLQDCIFDYGPVYSFWLFSFERENGILGSYKTNKKNIEVQLMKRFLKESWAREKEFNMNEQFTSIFEELSGTSRERGTLGDIYNTLQPSILEMSSHCIPIHEKKWNLSNNIFIPRLKDEVLKNNEETLLGHFYSVLYRDITFTVCTCVKVCKELYLNGTLLGSKTSRSKRSSYILAFWCDDDGTIDEDCTNDLTPHPGQIVKIYMHTIIIDGEPYSHYLAKVNWFKKVPDTIRHIYGKPIEVWSSNLYVQEGSATFIPIHRIKCRFVYTRTELQSKDVFIVSPRERHIL